jgi:integrase
VAREWNKLSPRKVASCKTQGFYSDGLGLWLQVSKWGTKSWVFRYKRDGRGRYLGLGPLHTVSLAEARERARQARQTLLDGKDPIEAKRQFRKATLLADAKRKTFRNCAADYLAEHSDSWKNAKHRAQWASSIERANKAFGDLDVVDIDVDIILNFLRPIWRKTPETGSRIRGRVEAILDWATAANRRQGENPARWRGHLEHLLKAKPKATHHPALPFSELPAFMAELREHNGISARALEFTILTAARTSEAIGAKWDEIDLEAKIWTVPPKRMKAGRQHRVPLSNRTVELLEALPRDTSGFVFIGASIGKPISNMAMLQLLRGMPGRDGLTVHGFRSTFSDWARERTAFPRDVVEMALAHAIRDKSEAAYRRGDALEKRRRLMAEWVGYCQSPAVNAEVVALHG